MTTSDQARDGLMRFGWKLSPLDALLVGRLKVTAQQLLACQRRWRYLLEQAGVRGALAEGFLEPLSRVWAAVFPTRSGQFFGEVSNDVPGGWNAGPRRDP